MTTIAWDGVTIAADSQATAGNAVCTFKEQKIFHPRDDENWSVNDEKVFALGFAGDCGSEFEVQELMRQGLTYSSSFTPEPSFSLIAVVGKGRAYLISKESDKTHASTSVQLDPYAMGSGGMIARTAMACGKSAIDAVHIAIGMDVYTGGTVNYFTLSSIEDQE